MIKTPFETVLLKDVVYFQEGPGLRNWQYGISGVPFLNIRTLTDEGLIDKSLCQFIKQEEFEGKYEHFLLNEGDYVVSSSGTLGKLAEVRSQDLPLMLNTSVIRFRPLDENVLNRAYLKWFIKSPLYLRQIEKASTGTAIKNYGPSHLKQMIIPLPPLPEQRRIAAILDRADAVRRKRQEAIALTEELLRSAFLEMFGDPVTNPKGWKVKPLGEIAQFVGGGTPSRKESKFFEGSICWATSKDMGVDVLADTEEHITLEAIESSATQLVGPECLLLVVKSKILMRRLPVARTVVPTCFSQDIKAVIPHQDWMIRYLHRHLRFGETVLLKQARGVNTEGLTLEHLRNYPVMLPLKVDIKRFADLEVAISNKIKIQESSVKTSYDLFNSLLQRAFRGEL